MEGLIQSRRFLLCPIVGPLDQRQQRPALRIDGQQAIEDAAQSYTEEITRSHTGLFQTLAHDTQHGAQNPIRILLRPLRVGNLQGKAEGRLPLQGEDLIEDHRPAAAGPNIDAKKIAHFLIPSLSIRPMACPRLWHTKGAFYNFDYRSEMDRAHPEEAGRER